MNRILISNLALFLLWNVDAQTAGTPQKVNPIYPSNVPTTALPPYDTATPKKCTDGWQSSSAYKLCTGGEVGTDPQNPRTCLLQNVTCQGTFTTSISVQPHQLANLTVCSGYLTIGDCPSSPPTPAQCLQNWKQSLAYQSNLCAADNFPNPTNPFQIVNDMCQFQMTCTDTDTGSKIDNGSLTYPPSDLSALQVCSGLLKTGPCKRK